MLLGWMDLWFGNVSQIEFSAFVKVFHMLFHATRGIT